jgi:hypothetical protein
MAPARDKLPRAKLPWFVKLRQLRRGFRAVISTFDSVMGLSEEIVLIIEFEVRIPLISVDGSRLP